MKKALSIFSVCLAFAISAQTQELPSRDPGFHREYSLRDLDMGTPNNVTAPSPKLSDRNLAKAADFGDPVAQAKLGLQYVLGDGVSQDDSTAVKWFLRASASGLPSAQFLLGYMYDSGRGVPRDVERAARWFKAAAEKGNPHAQAALASLYTTGKSVRRILKRR